MKHLLTFLALGVFGLVALPTESAKAQNLTSTSFAQFSQTPNSPLKPFTFENNNVDGAGQSLLATASSVPVAFTFLNSPFLADSALTSANGFGVVAASLTWTSSANADASTLGGDINQMFNSGTLTIVYTGPNTTIGSTNLVAGDLLLQVTYTSGLLTGQPGSSAPTFQASEPVNTVTYSSLSKYFDFSQASNENFSLGFSGLASKPYNPPTFNSSPSEDPVGVSGFRVTSNGLVRSFRGDGSGTFAAAFVPEPATIAMAGLGLIALPTVLAVRRRRSAR